MKRYQKRYPIIPVQLKCPEVDLKRWIKPGHHLAKMCLQLLKSNFAASLNGPEQTKELVKMLEQLVAQNEADMDDTIVHNAPRLPPIKVRRISTKTAASHASSVKKIRTAIDTMTGCVLGTSRILGLIQLYVIMDDYAAEYGWQPGDMFLDARTYAVPEVRLNLDSAESLGGGGGSVCDEDDGWTDSVSSLSVSVDTHTCANEYTSCQYEKASCVFSLPIDSHCSPEIMLSGLRGLCQLSRVGHSLGVMIPCEVLTNEAGGLLTDMAGIVVSDLVWRQLPEIFRQLEAELGGPLRFRWDEDIFTDIGSILVGARLLRSISWEFG